jgi:hypothetical protein
MNTFKLTSVLFLLIGTTLLNKATAQNLSNADFEQTDSTGTHPLFEDWSGDILGSGISTQAHSGTYSINVWNWYYYSRGYAMNGADNFYLDAYKSGTPYSQKATRLNGFYYYDTTGTDSEDDSALVAVLLKKYNTSTQSIDTIGYGRTYLPHHAPGDLTFASFEVIIEDIQPGMQPDSIVILLQSSKDGSICNVSGSGYCLYFSVDALSLETPLGITDVNENKIKPQIYPNPSNGNFTVDFPYGEMESIKIISIDGKLIYDAQVNGMRKFNLSLNDISAGIYVAEIKTVNGIVMKERFILH